MARRKISEELWVAWEPWLPAFAPSRKGGRRRSIDDRAVLNGILYALQTGIPWEDLPQALGSGSGMTCWRRLRDWQDAGVWESLHLAMLTRLREHDRIDWSRASIDGSSVASPRGPRDRAEPQGPRQARYKRHIIVDARGVPLAVAVSGANRHESMVFDSLIDAIPAVPGLDGRPRKQPAKLHADKGYDYRRCREYLSERGITARIARKGVESKERLDRHRWVVERTHACFAGFGRLRVRFERRLDIHMAAAIICSRFVDDLC